jgi:multimeric flavodoxin WrbA
MKVLALNGSPRRAATAHVLDLFLEGVEEAGGEVELVRISKLDVKPCRGCFTCWTTTPGECIQKDDMTDMLPRLDEADVVVIGTPVYVDGMTGLMKNFLDRMIPLDNGKVVIRDGHCRHPRRSGRDSSKVVLVSVCGFHEMDNFDPLVMHVKALCKNMNAEYVGAVLRPYAWALSALPSRGIDVSDVVDAIRDAGRQLVEKGKFEDDTLKTISKELIPQDIVAQVISSQFR